MLFLRCQLLRILSFAFGSSFILKRDQLGTLAQTAIQPMISLPCARAAVRRDRRRNGNGKSNGVGGPFLRAHDPTALGRWYQQHLGVSLTPSSYEESDWQQEAGPTVFTPFAETSNYFGDVHKVWMVNFRVRHLDKMAAQLRAAGIVVEIDPQSYPNGRFARLHDPEGNPIEFVATYRTRRSTLGCQTVQDWISSVFYGRRAFEQEVRVAAGGCGGCGLMAMGIESLFVWSLLIL